MKALLPVILLCSVALTAFAPASTLVKQEGYKDIMQTGGLPFEFASTFKAVDGQYYTFSIEYDVAKTIDGKAASGTHTWAHMLQ